MKAIVLIGASLLIALGLLAITFPPPDVPVRFDSPPAPAVVLPLGCLEAENRAYSEGYRQGRADAAAGVPLKPEWPTETDTPP